jgi:hypothetical protein
MMSVVEIEKTRDSKIDLIGKNRERETSRPFLVGIVRNRELRPKKNIRSLGVWCGDNLRW